MNLQIKILFETKKLCEVRSNKNKITEKKQKIDVINHHQNWEWLNRKLCTTVIIAEQ
jgi:hypothetical protein